MSPAPRVSVVIPTLNEASYLPCLLHDLAHQTVPAFEVIVADAGSKDGTRELAEGWGATVVEGGHPGLGRNRGAEVARGSHLLFLDADVRLPLDGVETALREMERGGLEAASSWFVPDRGGPFFRLGHWLSCHYFRLSTQLGWPHSIGAFLMLPRSLHERIGGFDVSIKVAEDQDYVRRCARLARYGFLRRPEITIATRRFESEGRWSTSLKWLGIELHRATMGEIRADYFRYFK